MSDGLTRFRRYPEYMGKPFTWEDGNFACNCNREWEFVRALEGAFAEDPDCVCGDGKYLVAVRRIDTGEILYSEIE